MGQKSRRTAGGRFAIRDSYVGTLDQLHEVIALGRAGTIPPTRTWALWHPPAKKVLTPFRQKVPDTIFISKRFPTPFLPLGA
jgi:hypothetical protein